MRISDWSSDVCSSDLLLEWETTNAGDKFPKKIAGMKFFSQLLNRLDFNGLPIECGNSAEHGEAKEGQETHGIGRHRDENRTDDRGILIEPVEQQRDGDPRDSGDENDHIHRRHADESEHRVREPASV